MAKKREQNTDRKTTRPNQRVAITKRMLEEALLDLLRTKTIDEISVTELCERAGINRTTFYAHYRIPEDILDEMQQNMMDSFIAIEQQKYPNGCKDHLSFYQDLCRFIYDRAEEMKILLANVKNIDPKKIYALYRNRDTLVSTFLQHTFSENEMSLIIAFIAGGVYHLCRAWLIDNIPMSPEEVGALMYKIVDEGREEISEI